MIRPKLITALGDPGIYIGEKEYTSGAGTFIFEVPQAVRRIHAVAVGGGAQGAVFSTNYFYDYNGGGGGGLGWRNNIEVEPGEKLAVIVGGVVGQYESVAGVGSGIKRTDENDEPTGEWLVAGLSPTRNDGYGDGGNFIGDGGGRGGNGSGNTTYNNTVASMGSGGGAGGYRGNGGSGRTNGGDMDEVIGGGGSGGHSANRAGSGTVSGARGGGVGIYGEGASGAVPRPDPLDWDQEYGATPGNPGSGGDKMTFGAGGAGNDTGWNGSESTRAGPGAVRIIWGNKFSYPDNADVEAVD